MQKAEALCHKSLTQSLIQVHLKHLSNFESELFLQNSMHKFDKTGQDSCLRFCGNVNVRDGVNPVTCVLWLPPLSIFKNYAHVLFTIGCTLPVFYAELPPLEYCILALSLIHWCTQHPNTPKPPHVHKISHVSIIRNGNISVDVACMLLTNASEPSKYDVPSPVASGPCQWCMDPMP